MVIEVNQEPTSERPIGARDFLLFDGNMLIGTASFARADRAGGTLICRFTPTIHYDVHRHAAADNVRDALVLARRRLSAARADGAPLAALQVCIYDHEVTSSLRTREAYIIGIGLEAFDSYLEDAR